MQTRRTFLNPRQTNQSAAVGYWLHVNRAAMACRFEVTLPLSDQAGVVVARDALAEVDRLEAQLTVFRESSEVSYINCSAAVAAVRVEASLYALLFRCQQLYTETEGAFDITSGPLTRVWGFLQREGRLPATGEVDRARSFVGTDKLLLNHEARTVRFAQA